MYKVTPSGIGSLLECPRCLWLVANEKIKRPEGIFPSLPGGFDGLFKKYFDEYRDRGEIPPEIRGQFEGKLFDDRDKLDKWRKIGIGNGLAAEFIDLDISLKGSIDDLLVTGEGKYVPFDFKTRGYEVKEDTHAHYQHQLDLYALLFQQNSLPVADFGFLLFFWPEEYREGNAKFRTQLVKMSVSSGRGMLILQEVYKIISGPKPRAHEECEFCLYRDGETRED